LEFASNIFYKKQVEKEKQLKTLLQTNNYSFFVNDRINIIVDSNYMTSGGPTIINTNPDNNSNENNNMDHKYNFNNNANHNNISNEFEIKNYKAERGGEHNNYISNARFAPFKNDSNNNHNENINGSLNNLDHNNNDNNVVFTHMELIQPITMSHIGLFVNYFSENTIHSLLSTNFNASNNTINTYHYYYNTHDKKKSYQQ